MNAIPTETTRINAVARIGNGEKVHPCVVDKIVTNPGTPWARTSYRRLMFTCQCPGTQNGHAASRASLVLGGVRTCGG